MDASRLAVVGSFVRFSALGSTLLIPLLGAASADPGLIGSLLPGLLAAAAALHVFGYVLNDVVDLPIDRTDPRRKSSPLVRGTVRRWQALAVAVAQVPIAFGLTAWLDSDARAVAALSTFVVLGAAYNLWGKRTRLPLLTDVIQGLAWSALALWGAAIAGRWTPMTGVFAAYVVVLIVMVNGVHGSLRDLANDHRCGARSTAIVMGARVSAGGGLIVPRRLRRYAVGLQVALTAIALTPLLLGDVGRGRPGHAAALAAVLLLAAAAACLAGAAGSLEDPVRLRSAGMLHLVVLLALPIALVAPRLPPILLAAILLAYLTPTLTNRWMTDALRSAAEAAAAVVRRGSGARQKVADLLRLTRAENCAAAAAAVMLGGYLAGGPAALQSDRLLRAALVAAMTVATVNVANDRSDAAIDAYHKPHRPLPSGRVSSSAAGRLATLLGVLSTLLSLTLDLELAAAAAVLLSLGLAYCYRLKDTVFVGNAVVALLAASTVIFGAQVSGRLTASAAVASLLMLQFMLGFEVLKTLADREADASGGLRTVATVWGKRTTLRVHRAAAVGFLAAALLPWPLGLASVGYGWAILATGILPVLAATAMLARAATSGSIQASIYLMKVTWLPGLFAMALLR
jgi:4-hydroxybenzoate polyprenyltransferase